MKSTNENQGVFIPKPFNGLGSTYRVASINTQRSASLSMSLENHAMVVLLEKPRIYLGYMNGYRQPVGMLATTCNMTEFATSLPKLMVFF